MTIGIVGNSEKPRLPEVAAQLFRLLRDRSVPFLLHDELAPAFRGPAERLFLKGVALVSGASLARRATVIISLGGDGTILRTARLIGAREIPILGVNLGKLGFLAEVNIEDLQMAVSDVLEGRYQAESRMMLLADGKGLGKGGYGALNDIVIDLSGTARVIHVETRVNGVFVATFTGDGVMVSTPTGSTGYALSNGGPIITPDQSVMMISPISPHNLTARPIVLPDTVTIDLDVRSAPGKVHVTADGQPQLFTKAPVHVRVRKAPFRTILIKREGMDYFGVLRNKLQWGKDVRTDQLT